MKQSRTISVVAFLALSASPAMAEDLAVRSIREEIARMRGEYEARIENLERRLARAEAAPNRAAVASPKAKRTVETTTGRAAAPMETVAQPPESPATSIVQPNATSTGMASAFNPAIGMILNGAVSGSRRDPGAYRIPGFVLGPDARPAERGFALGESEINLSANIDRLLYGALTVSLARDNSVSLEEAFIQTTGLPGGFTLKGGRFFSRIGYLNEQHAHTWDFVDAPLPYLAMLNNQYGDDGVQVRWLAPTKMFVELGGEAFRGDAFPARGAANKGSGSFSVFGHIGDDIGAGGEGGSWRIGVSELWTRASGPTSEPDSFSGNDRVTVIDGVYKWAPNGNFADRFFKLQGEYFHRVEEGQFGGFNASHQQQGFYVQGIWQFMPRWRVGARYDQVWGSAPAAVLAFSPWDPRGHVGRRGSMVVDYSTSEFGRFRLQGNLDYSTGKYDPQVILQYTVSLGAHGAHAY